MDDDYACFLFQASQHLSYQMVEIKIAELLQLYPMVHHPKKHEESRLGSCTDVEAVAHSKYISKLVLYNEVGIGAI